MEKLETMIHDSYGLIHIFAIAGAALLLTVCR
jgi:hypothetical protein